MTGSRPSERLRSAIIGAIPLADAPQEWLGFIVYRFAAAVLQEPDKDARRRALARVPAAIRELVEAEALRLWNNRRS